MVFNVTRLSRNRNFKFRNKVYMTQFMLTKKTLNLCVRFFYLLRKFISLKNNPRVSV